MEVAQVQEILDSERVQKNLTYGAIGLGVTLGIYALYKIFGKDPIPFSDTTVPAGEVDEQKVRGMAAELYSSLEAWELNPFDSTRCDALRRYENFTNAEFVAVANFYMREYRKTIRDSIADTFRTLCVPNPLEHINLRMAELNIP